jgi:filamentous hemagglutinin
MVTAVVVAILCLLAPSSSAAPLLPPQTRVAAIEHPASQLVVLHDTVLPGGSRPRAPSYDGSATGSSVAAEGETDLNLATEARTEHILQGDATGGGHLWPGAAGKSAFPESWSSTRIMNTISDIATDPAAWQNAVTQGGRTVLTGSVDGVDVRVVVDTQTGEIITGYPTNLPRNP